MALDMRSVNERLTSTAGTIEGNIRQELADSEELDDKQLIELQMDMSKWTLVTQLQSNMIKTISESCKNTVSNIR